MSVKSSISLTEQQDAFARALVEAGHYSSLSAVLQQGLELLRQKTEAEMLERQALRALVERRMAGSFVSAAAMDERLEHMIERKRQALALDN